jgi:hypothetical protein
MPSSFSDIHHPDMSILGSARLYCLAKSKGTLSIYTQHVNKDTQIGQPSPVKGLSAH